MKEALFAKSTLGSGSAWDIAFSKDPQQKYIYLADGTNEKVRVILRETLQEITNFGDGGRQPGQFYGVHSIATDSKGNIYTTETYEGKRAAEVRLQGRAAGRRRWPGHALAGRALSEASDRNCFGSGGRRAPRQFSAAPRRRGGCPPIAAPRVSAR